MLSWPSTVYRNKFLSKIIRTQADFLTRTRGWSHLISEIADYRLKKLAEMTWDIWEELGLFESLAQDQDFQEARAKLIPLLPKSRKPAPDQKTAKKPGPKKKPPMLQIMEETTGDSYKDEE